MLSSQEETAAGGKDDPLLASALYNSADWVDGGLERPLEYPAHGTQEEPTRWNYQWSSEVKIIFD